jgi:hypothetical protein
MSLGDRNILVFWYWGSANLPCLGVMEIFWSFGIGGLRTFHVLGDGNILELGVCEPSMSLGDRNMLVF